MPRLLPVSLLAALLGAASAASAAERLAEAASGGKTSVPRNDRQAFAQPAANLSAEQQLRFAVGNSFFRSPWVIAPASTSARDGLGPLFNTNACSNCHIRDGRGQLPNPQSPHAAGFLLRLSIPPEQGDPALRARLGVVPEPVYGVQLQDRAIPGLRPEARLALDYETHRVRFTDGHEIELRRPLPRLTEPAYGPFHPQLQTSLRVAPPMIGLGLLEAVPEEQILALADPQDADGDGISGRPNFVHDLASGKTRLGRFGWKAGQPSLAQQNAHALANDLGLTSGLLPRDDCTPSQGCAALPHGGEPEVSENILAHLLFYTRTLAVPMRRHPDRPQVAEGARLFEQAGCPACHAPSLTTAADASEPALANQRIRPYTDLLLHDMGEGLADGRPEFDASGREWRTPPLWGLGLAQRVNPEAGFLHDGRARDVLEAILWHGGEAQAARDRVLQFDSGQRAALLAFLQSL